MAPKVSKKKAGEQDEAEAPYRQLPQSAYFNDGVRIIDFVLAFEPKSGGRSRRIEFAQMRQKYEHQLRVEGLCLEYVGTGQTSDGKTSFVKVHAPWNTLVKQAELLELHMPVALSDLADRRPSCSAAALACFADPFRLQPQFRQAHADYFTDTFTRSRINDFLIDDHDRFFPPSTRIYLTWTIMSSILLKIELCKMKAPKGKESFDVMDMVDLDKADGACKSRKDAGQQVKYERKANIEYLLQLGVYKAAYPLHDADVDEPVDKRLTPAQWPTRRYLYESWAKPSQWRRYQPIEEIRQYYGVEMAMYFAFLGFYTKLLVPAALLGVAAFVYGLLAATNDKDVDAFCRETTNGSFVICRQCPELHCGFEKDTELCVNAFLSRTVDNDSASYYSFLMALWGVIFINLWQRYQAELCQRWHVGEELLKYTEALRPEFVLKNSTVRISPVTKKPEPYLAAKAWFWRRLLSYSVFTTLLLAVLGLLGIVVAYYNAGPVMWAHVFEYKDERGATHVAWSPSLVTSLTASLLNGAFVAIMQYIYAAVSWKLTEFEMHRTEADFEKSHTYKSFVFQSVNYYGALFYLSFVRGQWPSTPADVAPLGRCRAVGCLLEIAIQLAIIMIGKQAINNIFEIGVFIVRKRYSEWRARRAAGCDEPVEDMVDGIETLPRWEKDLKLSKNPPLQLFNDYLEMVIQYGFVTFFVAAFPLAPFFALLNNIIEIRLDASKFLVYSRRCIPTRAKDIGHWFDILTTMSKLSVVTNAALIAWNTDLIDRIVYGLFTQLGVTRASSFNEFLMSRFKVSDWCGMERGHGFLSPNATTPCEQLAVVAPGHSVDWCLFRGYYDRLATGAYALTTAFYVTTVARFIYVFVVEHLVFVVQGVFRRVIADVPSAVRTRQQRERHLRRSALRRKQAHAPRDDLLPEREQPTAPDDDAEWRAQLRQKMADFGPPPPPPKPKNWSRRLKDALINKL